MTANSAHRLGFIALSSMIGVGLIVLVTLALGTVPVTSALPGAAAIFDAESVIRPHLSTAAQSLRAPARAPDAPWVKIVDRPVFAYQGQPVTLTVAWGDIPTDGTYKLRVQLENKLLTPACVLHVDRRS